MNIVNKLTVRHLKENKRRTLVTIFGVIISVAMLTAVSTLGVSFLDLMKRDAIADEGEWHVLYKDVDAVQLEAIENDKETNKLILSSDFGFAPVESTAKREKPFLFLKGYSEQGFSQFQIKLEAGRFPKAPNEIVLVKELQETYKIGDTLNLELGDRKLEGTPLTQNDPYQKQGDKLIETFEKSGTGKYTITGFIETPNWENSWSPAYSAFTYIDKTAIGKSKPVHATVVAASITNDLYDYTQRLADKLGIKEVSYNDTLLRLYGVTDNSELRLTLYTLSAIIMAIIVIGSVSLIYNAFAISVSERARHLGMLSSVGATKKQKRNSVFFEGVVIGGISIPLGILAGLAGLAVTFWFSNALISEVFETSERLRIVVTPMSILVACAVSILTIFISTYWPARKASKISAIDAIRQTQDVKLTGKSVKTSKFVRRLFGIEAEIGLKNIIRNKKRYRATVFSLVISLVLFLTVSFFTDNLKKSFVLSQEKVDYDMKVFFASDGQIEQLKPFSSLKHVTDYSLIKPFSVETHLEMNQLPKSMQEPGRVDKSMMKDGKVPYIVVLYGLDEKSFAAVAEKAGVNPATFANPKNPAGIVIENTTYQDGETGKFIEERSIETEVGHTLDLSVPNYDTGSREPAGKLTIAGFVDEAPMGIQTGMGDVPVLVPEKILDQLAAKLDNQYDNYLVVKSTDPLETQAEIEEMNLQGLHIYNVYKQRQNNDNLILFMSLFTYGFIVLISLISIANILNTISTSISLRTREFAMLKSVGMTPKGFSKMTNYESIFYGVKALTYGLPISIGLMYLIYLSLSSTFEYGFELPWSSIAYATIAIFLIVTSAMLYSSRKIKTQNIIDGLRQESI
ncbi:FtsX-like permease family protein [Bacillus sp. EB01]|uniref:FtsX-like permease family protein n=1 Tax=Bacillus sp. EB01 TaxID=1347086 RepID=UPI0005C5E68E|nr:FtsX-like permease family protein [Bacillus sp. EB01]